MDTDLDGPFGQLFGDSGSLFCAPPNRLAATRILFSLSLSVLLREGSVGWLVLHFLFTVAPNWKPTNNIIVVATGTEDDGEEWTKVDDDSVGECSVRSYEGVSAIVKQQH